MLGCIVYLLPGCREGYASLPEAPHMHLCGVAARGKFARHVHVVLLQQLCLPLLMTLPPAEDEDAAHAATAAQQGPEPAAGHGSNLQCEVSGLRRLLTLWHCRSAPHALHVACTHCSLSWCLPTQS